MAEDLFQGLPPPSAANISSKAFKRDSSPPPSTPPAPAPAPAPAPPPPPILKSVLKRDKPSEPHPAGAGAAAPQKRIRFKTTVDASEAQVIEAMQKITSHIKNHSKFGKASKLAVQLIQAGSVKKGNIDYFFAILDAAMSSPSACTDPSLRADYQALFLAAEDVADCLSKQQKNQLSTWTIRAVVANDLFTDDSFVFSKVAGRIKEAISSLPVATEEDDHFEAAVLERDENEVVASASSSATSPGPDKKEECDPFGLDALLPSTLRKDEQSKGRKDAGALNKKAQEVENKRYLKSQREALVICLEIAARRYKVLWAQTILDILVKHAFDNVERFTSEQRNAIEKLWTSIKEQQTRRKQGKSVTGKLDMNAFEWLQEKYAGEKISIRHSVGGGGDRSAEQWLG